MNFYARQNIFFSDNVKIFQIMVEKNKKICYYILNAIKPLSHILRRLYKELYEKNRNHFPACMRLLHFDFIFILCIRCNKRVRKTLHRLQDVFDNSSFRIDSFTRWIYLVFKKTKNAATHTYTLRCPFRFILRSLHR